MSEARVYTCVVLDAYSRRAVGSAISRRADTTLVNSAIDMAVNTRPITPWNHRACRPRAAIHGVGIHHESTRLRANA